MIEQEMSNLLGMATTLLLQDDSKCKNNVHERYCWKGYPKTLLFQYRAITFSIKSVLLKKTFTDGQILISPVNTMTVGAKNRLTEYDGWDSVMTFD
ncbi:hypothetical protein TNCV_4623501 [Trichonephila clavipes]|nr:hypothetical protein TNCV_4623501 [Trichonephila clavipes]